MPNLLDQIFSGHFKKGDKKHDSPSNETGSKNHSKTPPPPPPQKDELTGLFEDLSLGQKGKHPNAEFVGGFKHGPANPDGGRRRFSASTPAFPTPIVQSSAPSPHLPHPPQMLFPTPQYQPSRTMQYALSGDSSDPTWLELEPTPSKLPKPPRMPARPHSDEPPRATNSANAPPARLEVNSTPKHRRAVSSPPMSPTTSKNSSSAGNGGDDRIQCSGITKKGERCSRRVKAVSHLNIGDPERPLERFCHQHRDEILNKQTGFFPKGKNEWIDFPKFIPEYLHPDTKAALRIEMEKPPTQSDEPGYIYVFEIRDPANPFMLQLKVGRTVVLTGRLNDWQKQCGSKEQVFRGWWPGNIASDEVEESLMKVLVQAGGKGAFCHKLERLVHLELADLVYHMPYTQKGFPNVPNPNSPSAVAPGSNPGTPAKAGKRSGASSSALNLLQQASTPCQDCGKVHKEIFSFTRPESGPYKGHEWDKLVKPVIKKWGFFVAGLA